MSCTCVVKQCINVTTVKQGKQSSVRFGCQLKYMLCYVTYHIIARIHLIIIGIIIIIMIGVTTNIISFYTIIRIHSFMKISMIVILNP